VAPSPKTHQYEAAYNDMGIPEVVVALWDQSVTKKERVYFYLAPEAEVLIYDPETISAIQKRNPDINDFLVQARRWKDIQKLLREDPSVVPLAELEKKRFRVAITREVWEIPHPMMLAKIAESIRAEELRIMKGTSLMMGLLEAGA